MAQPLVGSGNRIRLAPLEQAVVASKGLPAASAAGGMGGRASGLSPVGDEPDVPGQPDEAEPTTADLDPNNPAHVQAAAEAAKAGDQSAINWLKAIGIGTGVLAAGTAAAYASGSHAGKIMNDQRGGKGPDAPHFGAMDIRDTSPKKVGYTPQLALPAPVTDFTMVPGAIQQPGPPQGQLALPAPSPLRNSPAVSKYQGRAAPGPNGVSEIGPRLSPAELRAITQSMRGVR